MVYVLLGEGFEEAEAIVPIDLLRRAGVSVSLVGLDSLSVTGGQGITLQADCLLSQIDEEAMELLMLPGGTRGVDSIYNNPFAMALIQRACDKGVWVGAICAAPTLLTPLGVLDRRQAVCYPSLSEAMGSAVVNQEASVVVDGRFITARAAGASFDFGLAMITALRGAEVAIAIQRSVYYK